ncbi:MAG TPA: LPP20 family lipoprotein [Nitrospiria bacterium]|nr:LPP20 family lipoprotein [Nitrospiria bacterium]
MGSDRIVGFGSGRGWRVLTVLIAGVIFLDGPASFARDAAAPDWVNGPSKKYPEAIYLTGVGYADTRQAAEDRAYAAISKIFAAEISSKTEEWEKYLQTDAKGRTEDSRQINIEQATEVSTKKVLENVTIAERWTDESKALYYALAVMDRQHAAAALRDRVASLDLKVEELLKQTRSSGPKLQTVRAYHEAVENILLREAYNTELRVVSSTGHGSESGVSLADVNRDFRDFLSKNFRIVVEVGGANSEPVRAAIVEGLNRQGLPVASAAASDLPPDLVVKGAVTLDPVQMPAGGAPPTYFVRWAAAFDLTDKASQQVIGSVARQGREGHLTQPEAEARALRTAEKEVSDEVGRQIAEFIYGKENP